MIAERGNVKLISVEQCAESFMAEIESVDRVIVEAMLGAIIADSLRIPWIRLRAIADSGLEPKRVSEFKWEDWMRLVEADPENVITASIPR